jgi:hypothetical protein
MAKTAKAPGIGKYGAFIGIAASVLAIMVIVAVTQFELYERTRWVRPSSEAQSDNFYVIGKWLSASGHPVRFRPSWTGMENLSPGDGGLYLQASLFDWEKDGAALLPWIREGGSLLIAVDGDWYQGEASFPAPAPGLEEFLENLGLTLWYPVPDSIDDEEGYDEYEDEYDVDSDENSDLPEEEGFPVFDRAIALGLEDYGREALVLRDLREDIRLIRLPLGKGSVTVTGEWYFMYTRYLGGYPRNHENARAAWEFTAGSLQAERPGMLFVRGRRASGGFLRSLAGRGNLLAPVLSVLALILVGFWMVIPGFGIPLVERRKRPGTIGDRFSAEARFLSRYGAQRIYLETYLRELRRRAGGRDGGRKLNPEVEKVEEALAAGKKLSRREMAVYLKNLMSALERV